MTGVTTRRQLLITAGALGTLAGCTTRQESSPRSVCETGILGPGGDAIFTLEPTLRSFGAGEEPLVELVVPIRQATIESETVDQFSVFNDETLLYQIPVNQNDDAVGETNRYDTDDVVEYSQSLGHVPQTGIYRIVALDSASEQLDELGIEFRCYHITTD